MEIIKKMVKLITVLLLMPLISMGQVFYAGTKPGTARSKEVKKDSFSLWNNVLQANYTLKNGHLQEASFLNRQTAKQYRFDGAYLFNLGLREGGVLTAKSFLLEGSPQIKYLKGNPAATRRSEKENGRQLRLILYNEQYHIQIQWSATLRDSSNYVISQFSIKDPDRWINTLYLVNLPKSADLVKTGSVDGTPIVDKENFFAVENPMAKIDTTGHLIRIKLERAAALHQKDDRFISSVAFGVTPKGQLRRGFLYYLQQQRARPYHPFVHYNSWFDISWNGLRLHESDCLDRIQMWSDSLTKKRGVRLDGYLWDDGWDNTNSLWAFNQYLPDGFSRLYALSKQYGASMGAWISPWGGYEQAKQNRLAFGRKHIPAYETNENGFSLAGKNYFAYFKSLVEQFITKEHVAIFKFDGIGAGAFATGAGAAYQGDIQALLQLLTEIRKQKPDIYVSLTAGTWASPFFLLYGDNIWHGGGDYDFMGAGDKRQRWLNYRDDATYQNVVKRSSLYPLNAVMVHGIIDAANGWVATTDTTAEDMTQDIWAFFGNGTSLQELYINPHYLSSQQWDVLAKAIRWSRAHQDVLSDVHWVGGSPKKEEVYGFASWNPKHGTLMLRNPASIIQTYQCTLDDVLELPTKYKRKYSLYNVVKDTYFGLFASGERLTITLQPFEVKVFNVQ